MNRTILALALLALAPRTSLFAQTTVTFGGRVQAQYRAADGDTSSAFTTGKVSNGFEIRRLRLQVDGRIGANATFVIQPSFEMGALRMRDAYVKLHVASHAWLSAGQEKSPFQRYELTSSNTLPSIERGLRNLRLGGREGLNDLLVANGYASHDIGVFALVTAAGDRVSLKAGVQNGSRESSADVNNAKSVFGRVTGILLRDGQARPRLQAGFAYASRDRAVCSTCAGTIAFYPDSSRRTSAWDADLEWGGFRPGLHVIADLAGGDNVRLADRVNAGRNTGNVRTSADTTIATFLGTSVVASWRIPVGGTSSRIRMLEPALRIDWLDPERGVNGDDGLLLTPVLGIFFGETEEVKIGMDVYRYRAAGVSHTARELKVTWEAYF